MTPRSALWDAVRNTGMTRWAYARSVLAGTAALGSAVGLAAVAAWLVARAAQLPSPADLALAAVAVRFFGIGRGVFRYLERLLSHDTALRGVVTLRERTYERLAGASARTVLSLRRGDIIARAGSDLDAVGDAVVRSFIPVGVAVTVSALAAAIVTWQLPLAGLALAGALALAGFVPALLTSRQARIAADAGVTAAAEAAAASLSAVEASAEHRVWDEDGAAMEAVRSANRAVEHAADAAARPAALAAASQTFFSGLGLLVCLALGVAAAKNGDISGPAAAIVVLTPLAAFEAVGAIPAAIMQYHRSSAAALRLAQMSDERDTAVASATSAKATLSLTDLSVGWPGATPTPPVTASVEPGAALAIVGRSGVGKTTLLLTATGALPAVAGDATFGGVHLSPADAGIAYALTLEDAHLFGTTVLENLRVARGGVTEADAWDALARVGLADWVRSLPHGLDTELGTGGHTVSGGERRRLLMARALLADVPLQLLDEPGEHLDTAGIAAFEAAVTRMREQGRAVVIVTHDDDVMAIADQVISLDEV
ncbi:MAG: thiol reductant ABC exporter subunit CydC [Demequina sp.]|nr:thiol reductant ABC exporter subunit CydC [Demequina sp.]